MTLGLTNGTDNGGLITPNVEGARALAAVNAYGVNVSSTSQTVDDIVNGNVGVTTDPTKSGIETSSSGLKLYFYVGETIQDANVINASGVLTRVAELSDSYISGLGMPSDRYIDLTLGASGTEYVAPANGYFALNKLASATNQNILLYYTDSQLSSISWSTSNNCGLKAFVPVKKGGVVKANYTAGGSLESFRFIYAEGDK